MMGALFVSLLITTAVIAAVALLVRWAIREGEGNDPRWGLYGELDEASPLIDFATRAFAIPQPRTLILRGSRSREAAWEQSYLWTRVSMKASPSALILTGPFGQLTCPVPEGLTLEDVTGRFPHSGAGEAMDERGI